MTFLCGIKFEFVICDIQVEKIYKFFYYQKIHVKIINAHKINKDSTVNVRALGLCNCNSFWEFI